MGQVVSVSSSVDRTQLLWENVIVLAMADATKKETPNESQETSDNRADALLWLTSKHPYYTYYRTRALDLADVDPDFFAGKIKALLSTTKEVKSYELLWDILGRNYP